MRYLSFPRAVLCGTVISACALGAAAQVGAPAPSEYQDQVQEQNQGQTQEQTQTQTQDQTPSPAGSVATAPESGSPAALNSGQAMPPAPPEEHAEAVRLSDVEGSVRLTDATTGKLFDRVRANMAMFPGMRLETAGDGRAELEFADGAVVRVTPNSAFELVSITRDEAGHAHVLLRPFRGLSYYELPLTAEGYEIQIGPLTATQTAPDLSGTIPETALLRVSLDATPYEAAVLRGAMQFEDKSGGGGSVSYDLQANQTAKIDPQSAGNYDVVTEISPDTWDAWNTDRDSVLAQMTGSRPSNDEPGGPGWSDLDYYGSWYNVPGQGMAWAPDGVDQNFDPYGSGAWSYYSGVGYSWTSSYPWGWLPYHCGLWNYYGSYGWMWQPANCGWGYGGAWFPYSETRGRAGYHFPVRPNPPRGITHVPRSQALIPVDRGATVHFRGIGEPRLAGRPAVIAGESLQPVPVAARPSYVNLGSGYRSSQGVPGVRSGLLQPGAAGYGIGSRVAPPSLRSISPAGPRFVAPSSAPRMSAPAPPPAAAAPAPHMSVPAAAGHH